MLFHSDAHGALLAMAHPCRSTHAMNIIRLILLAVTMASCGCSTTYKSEIQRVLAERKRTSVQGALFTLQENGILSSQEVEKIDCRGAYSKARPQIQAVQKRLRKLSAEQLKTLDVSLTNCSYWSGASYPYIKWDGYMDRQIMRRLGPSSNKDAR